MLECPYCHETNQEDLPTFHYPGIPGSRHIECQTCGQEFPVEAAQAAAEVSRKIARIVNKRAQKQ